MHYTLSLLYVHKIGKWECKSELVDGYVEWGKWYGWNIWGLWPISAIYIRSVLRLWYYVLNVVFYLVYICCLWLYVLIHVYTTILVCYMLHIMVIWIMHSWQGIIMVLGYLSEGIILGRVTKMWIRGIRAKHMIIWAFREVAIT